MSFPFQTFSSTCPANIQHHHFAVNFSFSCLSKFYVEFFILYTLSRIIKFSELTLRITRARPLCQRLMVKTSIFRLLIGQIRQSWLLIGCLAASPGDLHIVLNVIPEAGPGLERLVEQDDRDEEDDVHHGHRQANV